MRFLCFLRLHRWHYTHNYERRHCCQCEREEEWTDLGDTPSPGGHWRQRVPQGGYPPLVKPLPPPPSIPPPPAYLKQAELVRRMTVEVPLTDAERLPDPDYGL